MLNRKMWEESVARSKKAKELYHRYLKTNREEFEKHELHFCVVDKRILVCLKSFRSTWNAPLSAYRIFAMNDLAFELVFKRKPVGDEAIRKTRPYDYQFDCVYNLEWLGLVVTPQMETTAILRYAPK